MHRLTLLTLLATLALVAWGGTVTSTNSGLACGDHWPACFEVRRAEAGEAVRATMIPRMEGGVFLEHGHRLLAASVGLFAVGLVVLAYRGRPADRVLRRTAVAALVLVVAQGLLGAVTVWMRLPAAVTTSHLAFSMAFVASLVLLAWRTGPAPAAQDEPTPAALRLSQLAAAAVFVQLVLGAVVRHTGAAPACAAQFPLCNGQWLPETTPQWIQIVHRAWAFVVLGLVVVSALRARRARASARPFALAALGLVAVQLTLGMVTVWTGIRPLWATAHLLGGALLWVDVLAMTLALGPRGWPARRIAPPAADRPALAQGAPA